MHKKLPHRWFSSGNGQSHSPQHKCSELCLWKTRGGVLLAEQIARRRSVRFWNRLTSGSMVRAESAHITIDGIEYDVVLHVYGERDWRGFLIKPGSQVRIPERGASKEEVLKKLETALKERLRQETGAETEV